MLRAISFTSLTKKQQRDLVNNQFTIKQKSVTSKTVTGNDFQQELLAPLK